jgi:hypothetical protein
VAGDDAVKDVDTVAVRGRLLELVRAHEGEGGDEAGDGGGRGGGRAGAHVAAGRVCRRYG